MWTDVTPEEMKKFTGLLLYMSVLQPPRIRDFWRKGTVSSVPFPAAVMRRDQFMAILSNLRMSDPETDESGGRGDSDAFDLSST